MARRRGFTLTEVMMVIIIIGIMATMALPSYNKTVEREYFRGAQDMLQAIYAGEQVFFTVNNAYRAQPATLAEWRDELYMDDPNIPAGGPVTYAIDGVTATTFTATAMRNGGSCCSGGTISMNQDRTMTPGGAWPPP